MRLRDGMEAKLGGVVLGASCSQLMPMGAFSVQFKQLKG